MIALDPYHDIKGPDVVLGKLNVEISSLHGQV